MNANASESIAVVGGGPAGLTAARELARTGRSVTLFDKGRGVGGRTAVRREGEARVFDHGAQYFTARDGRFEAEVAAWVRDGVAAVWEPRLAVIECDEAGCRRGEPLAPTTRYVGTPGMNAPAKRLAEEVAAAGGRVVSGVRVGPLKRADGRWRLTGEGGDPLGDFDRVLVTAPAPQAAELLVASPAMANAAKSVQMTGCWAALVAFEAPLEADFDAAFVNARAAVSPLAWVARDGSKPARSVTAQAGDCWVLQGSPAWSEANLEAAAERAADALLQAFWEATGLPPRDPASSQAHLWRYALPETPLAEAVLADNRLGLYAAGDWCGGPRIEGAYLSGLAAAEAIRDA